MPRRFIIKDDMTDQMIGLRAFALKWEWMGRKDPPETPNLIQYWLTPQGATVIYVEDAAARVRYFLVNGPNAESAENDLRRTMRLFTRDEIVDEAREARGFDEESRAGRRLFVVAGDEFDQGVFDLTKKFFFNPDPRIRGDAINALGYPGWEQFRAILERLAGEDDDQEVRSFAKMALDAWDAEVSGKLEPPAAS